MGLWAIVPVKPLRKSKPHLAEVLSEEDCLKLSFMMLKNVLSALSKTPEVEQILVISYDTSVLSYSREAGFKTVQEDRNAGLNKVLRRAIAIVQVYSVKSVLILAADLPLVTSSDLSEFINRSGSPPEVIIAPDRRKVSVNGILINPVERFEFTLGGASLERNLIQAEKTHYRVEIVNSPTMQIDVDLPEDLDFIRQIAQPQN